jgi:hypothetical protein
VITEASSLTEVAFAVCTVLDAAGFTVVLTGGSAATFYAPDAYQSRDLDFVIGFRGTGAEQALATIGYVPVDDHYEHAASPFPIEFPPGPLMIGDDHITSWKTVRRGQQVLHVLSPTDTCRDRLAQYLFWNDFAGLEQALFVVAARRAEVDFDAIRAWCAREGHEEKYELFARRARMSNS